jgi:hypothetical protein
MASVFASQARRNTREETVSFFYDDPTFLRAHWGGIGTAEATLLANIACGLSGSGVMVSYESKWPINALLAELQIPLASFGSVSMLPTAQELGPAAVEATVFPELKGNCEGGRRLKGQTENTARGFERRAR